MSEWEEAAIPEAPALPQVAASEHDLIMMARALVGGPGHDLWAILCTTRTTAPKIGATCARLLEDTLRHTWRAVWMRGGARPGSSLAGGTVVRGRIWERHSPIPLAFSAATLQLLRWLVSTPFAAPASTLPVLAACPLTVGDQVITYLALDAASATPAARVIAMQPLVREAPLAWLGFAPLLASTHAAIPSFENLVEGAGAVVIEALGAELGRRWFAAELAKRAVTDPVQLIELGAAQDAVLTGFMTASDAHRRRDLSTFVLDAAGALLARDLPPALALDPRTPLSTRAKARLASGSLLRAIARWSEWDQQHRGIRFIDDDYAAAQLLLERFEPVGSAGSARAAGWLASLASLEAAPESPARAGSATIDAGTT